MDTLVIIPTQKEYDFFVESFEDRKHQLARESIGKLPVIHFPDLGIIVSRGGLGKVQFAIQTQHLLDAFPDCGLVVCAGAAGGLVNNLAIGDVVVATETVEHDILNRFGPPLLPKFRSDQTALSQLKAISLVSNLFQVHFGPIASGDEDVVEDKRKEAIHQLTGGLAVAWEGAGGARACQFSEVPFIEIRGITDGADSGAASDFETHLEGVMKNVGTLILRWVSG
jgi:adenosylhomocysteine nucleosidase